MATGTGRAALRKLSPWICSAVSQRSPTQPPTKFSTPAKRSGCEAATTMARRPPFECPPMSMRLGSTSVRVARYPVTSARSCVARSSPASDTAGSQA